MNRAEYREVYLKSEHWREQRLGALERAGDRCQVCNGTKRLDVHHRTYERLGNEAPMDLTVLCRGCHDLFHDSRTVKAPAKQRQAKKKPRKARKANASRKHMKLTAANDRLHQQQVENKLRQEAARAARQPRITVPME